ITSFLPRTSSFSRCSRLRKFPISSLSIIALLHHPPLLHRRKADAIYVAVQDGAVPDRGAVWL
ncbi:unnamed protein product, partial [Musa textilis]